MFPPAPDISLFLAFAAGLLSFVSPCVLPLVPSYVTYITGLTLEELTSRTERKHVRATVIANSLLFIGGFSAVFIAFGASASLVGQLLITYQDFIRKIGGILIVVFGLYVIGVFKLSFMSAEKRIHFTARPAGYVGSFLIGVAFAAGWTPCVGPILGTILVYAGTTDSMLKGVELLASYSLGIALPLFISSLAVDSFLNYFKKVRGYMYGISIASGVFLVMVGVLIYTNSLTILTSALERNGIGWYIGQ
jgi:cytochrome c-type biogenesis protein